MKKEIQPESEDKLRREFPITTEAEGWYFKTQEVRNGWYIVFGRDLYGRCVQREGMYDDVLLKQCTEDAININKQLSEPGNREVRGKGAQNLIDEA